MLLPETLRLFRPTPSSPARNDEEENPLRIRVLSREQIG